jgi:rubrerythrin
VAVLGNPFVANVSKQLSQDELIQALRVDIIGEMEAVVGYEAHAQASNDERVKKVLHHIADEEKRHIGELEQLLFMLNPIEGQYIDEGKQKIQTQEAQNFQMLQ